MIILTYDTHYTFVAQVRSSVESGFKVLYKASCTGGHKFAAEHVVRKYYGEDVAATVTHLFAADLIKKLTGDFLNSPKCKQNFTVWTFDANPTPFKYPNPMKSPSKTTELLAPESMLEGKPNTALSPQEASALVAAEAGWAEARRLGDLIKNYSRATTAAKTLCGIRLRALREYHFGPRSAKGGRPRGRNNSGESDNWASMLAEKSGLTERTARTWIALADVVEAMAEAQGLDLPSICAKLPWDWTPEEMAKLDATVSKLTEDKSQRELLQADFLSDLGYTAPERVNASNNPTGRNGGKKKATAATPAQLLRERQLAARMEIYGTEKVGRVEPGSHGFWLDHCINSKGESIEALPMAELRDFYEQTVKPFTDLLRKMVNVKH